MLNPAEVEDKIKDYATQNYYCENTVAHGGNCSSIRGAAHVHSVLGAVEAVTKAGMWFNESLFMHAQYLCPACFRSLCKSQTVIEVNHD